jgi:hypothetical protein
LASPKKKSRTKKSIFSVADRADVIAEELQTAAETLRIVVEAVANPVIFAVLTRIFERFYRVAGKDENTFPRGCYRPVYCKRNH